MTGSSISIGRLVGVSAVMASVRLYSCGIKPADSTATLSSTNCPGASSKLAGVTDHDALVGSEVWSRCTEACKVSWLRLTRKAEPEAGPGLTDDKASDLGAMVTSVVGVGAGVGRMVGDGVGTRVGDGDGAADGSGVGAGVGICEGEGEGRGVG